MKIKLTQLEELSKEETFYIIGGQVNPDKKKERQAKRAERKASRRVSSDTTDTSKNDTFKI